MMIMAVTRSKTALQESHFLKREYTKIAKRVDHIMEQPRMKNLLHDFNEDKMTDIRLELGEALCDERQDELDAQNARCCQVFTHSYIYQFSFSYTFCLFLFK